MLQRMRRNYTREAYLDLIASVREILPGATISTDLISGFCGETEEEHQDTLSLLRSVQFDNGTKEKEKILNFSFFFFFFSFQRLCLRTVCARRLMHTERWLTTCQQKVKQREEKRKENLFFFFFSVKQRRLAEVIATFHSVLSAKVQQEIGKKKNVLIERRRFAINVCFLFQQNLYFLPLFSFLLSSSPPSKRNASEWVGRSDENQRVVVFGGEADSSLAPGLFCDVLVESASSMTLRGRMV